MLPFKFEILVGLNGSFYKNEDILKTLSIEWY